MQQAMDTRQLAIPNNYPAAQLQHFCQLHIAYCLSGLLVRHLKPKLLNNLLVALLLHKEFSAEISIFGLQ